MKSVLMIGMGRFGHHLCENMVELGNEVMIIDEDEKSIADLTNIVTSALIGDCTDPEILKNLGVGNYDICFVCIGSNFQSRDNKSAQGAWCKICSKQGKQRYSRKVSSSKRSRRGNISRQRHC